MYGWEYNKKMMKDMMINNAKDFGKFYAELLFEMPKVYADFTQGFMEAIKEKEDAKNGDNVSRGR